MRKRATRPMTEAPGDAGRLREPGEARIRRWLFLAAALLGPPLLFIAYYKMMFPGLVNPDALDFAQIGRNMSAGRGFSTFFLRPLALTHGSNPLAQPDLTHGPLYPFVLSLAFGIFGAKAPVVAGVSGLFYLLTIPLIYLLGRRVFNPTVGLVTALIATFNALMLEYAASGLHITFYVFLMTVLLLAMHALAVWQRDAAGQPQADLPKGKLLQAGVWAGLLYLADPVFFWILPIVLTVVVSWNPRRRAQAALWAFLPMLVLAGPWMARNTLLTGNPIFGLRGMELWMNTKNSYPGYLAYRVMPTDLTAGPRLFQDVVRKILLGAGQIIQAFPQVTASWILAFFLPSLLFRFTDRAANGLRRVLIYCLLAIFFGTLLFQIQMPLFVSLIPAMLVFAVAYMLFLVRQAQLTREGVVLVGALLSVAVVFPLFSDVFLDDKTQPLKEVGVAQALGQNSQRGEVVLSDQPWIVAWYADRPSVWIPAQDGRIRDVRRQFAETRWLFLTDQTRGFSKEWQYVYDVFRQWNVVYARARDAKGRLPGYIRINGKGAPLVEALNGLTSVQPVETNPQAVIAFLPPRKLDIGMR